MPIKDLKQYISYDPPPDEIMKKYYDFGFIACLLGQKESDNPYKPSGHERDSTYEDEMHYHWQWGFNDADGEPIFKNGENPRCQFTK